ncbi:hypothetical protein KPH14_004671 [Odynerus spinipes]|uniref:Double-strand break repair protein n=1 Tax=Odynerus spinipes TaxID=1348599 RepID=A0AAD9VPW4_9HYME|nr:hypothetical protein KPH14_004671 [Odynerus spinipes]
MSLKRDSDTFKILVATDIHLGYQYDRNKGQLLYDSFATFEEILQYGKQYEVDFVLLGGDLFHDTKPSQTALIECMDLLRKYCFGPGDVKMEFLTDPNIAFEHCRFKTANYEDPNININMPVFTIHGNHDDPSFSNVGSIDILSVSGLINYFGKCTTLDKVTVEPIVLKKGSTHIALYGLSYINDQRLNRLIKHCKLKLKLPEDNAEKCFNIFVLHQNRIQHTQSDYVPENKLPPFLHLVIWGHEHECLITPEQVTDQAYYISQPGSSIATSLCESEAKPKYVGLLHVNGLEFKMKKLKLNTVRPFVFETISLHNNPQIEQKKKEKRTSSNVNIISEYVDSYIESELMSEARKQLTGHPKQPKEPLIRLRLLYNDEADIFETAGLSQKYCDKVANPMGMIRFRKAADSYSKSTKHSTIDASLDDFSEKFQFDDDESGWTQSVQESIKEYFDAEENKDLLNVLSVTGLNETLSRYIIKADEDVIQDVIENQVNKIKEYVKEQHVEKPEEIMNKVKEYRDTRIEAEENERQDVVNFLNNRSSKSSTREMCNDDEDDENDPVISDNNDDDNDDERISSKVTRSSAKGNARARGRARGRAASSRGTARSRGAKTDVTDKNTMNSLQQSSFLVRDKEKQIEKKKQSSLNQHKGYVSLSQARTPTKPTFINSSDSD